MKNSKVMQVLIVIGAVITVVSGVANTYDRFNNGEVVWGILTLVATLFVIGLLGLGMSFLMGMKKRMQKLASPDMFTDAMKSLGIEDPELLEMGQQFMGTLDLSNLEELLSGGVQPPSKRSEKQ